MAVSTGLRQGEILGLKWSDLDWKMKRLHIQCQLQILKNQGLVFSEPKSAAGKRVIVLSSTKVKKLREHTVRQHEARQIAGSNWEDNDLIIPSPTGTPLHSTHVFHDFKNLLKKVGLPDMRFHDLRHSAATLILQQGIHSKIVYKCSGHSDIST